MLPSNFEGVSGNAPEPQTHEKSNKIQSIASSVINDVERRTFGEETIQNKGGSGRTVSREKKRSVRAVDWRHNHSFT